MRCRRVVLLVAVVMVLVAPLAGRLQAAAPSFFAPVPDPVGWAGRFDFFFETTRCSDAMGGRVVSKIDRTGAVSVFATLFPRLGCFEEFVAVSPGLGSFADARDFVYVTQGRQLVEIDAGGGTVKTFFKFPADVPDTSNGIVFDSIGTWNFDAIVVAGSQVWRLRRETSSAVCASLGLTAPCGAPAGSPIPVTVGSKHKPVAVGGPAAVMPLTFSACAGGLLVASHGFMGGSVFCVKPDGAVRGPVALWPGAGGVLFIPPNPCPFGITDDSPPAGVFFTTFAGKGKVVQFPAPDFTVSATKTGPGLDGRAALVLSATGAGIGLLQARHPAPPALLPTFFDGGDEHRGADFCGRHRVKIKVVARKDTLLAVAVLSAPGFNPERVNCGPKLRFGRIGNEASFAACSDAKDDVNRDGVPDLTVLFDAKTSALGPNDRPWLTGFFKPHSPDEGFAGGD